MIPYGRQDVDQADIDAVVEVLRSDWLTQGPTVERFERRLCEITGASHAVAMSSGTAALHAAAAVGGLGPGDVVATSPLTFVASANAARYVGASVCFVDIDPTTHNLDVGSVPTDVDALIAVHFAGFPLDLGALRRRPRVVIEDAAHALGAVGADGPIGNCARSDMCCFSFHPVKAVTSAEGGAVTTNSAALAAALRAFREHGISRNADGPAWRYDVTSLGFNYRLSDVHAALGWSQLGRLGDFLERRGQLADRYDEALLDVDGLDLPPRPPSGLRHARHLYQVGVSDRDRVFGELRALGFGVQVHYRPVYSFTAFAESAGDPQQWPVAERVTARLVSLPMFPGLTEAGQDEAIAAIRQVLGAG